MKYYLYNDKAYYSERTLRQAIFESERKVFGKIEDDDWKDLGVIIQEETQPEKTLDELKTLKLDELQSVSSRFDDQLVNNDMIINSSLGFSVNADLRSQNNLRGLIKIGESSIFADAKNETHTLTLDQLNTLLDECILNGQSLYKQKWELRNLIQNAETKSDLEKIKIEFKMADFNSED